MKIFIAGPRAVKKLDKYVEEKLDNIIKNEFTLLIGDAAGVDKLVQQYVYNKHYDKVTIYASQGKTRNNIGNWQVEKVNVEGNIKGFDFYAAKDKKMAEDADYGFMIWNGESKGTLNNIIKLTRLNKTVLVYLIPYKKIYVINKIEKIEEMLSGCGNEIINLFKKLDSGIPEKQNELEMEQILIF